MSLSNIILNNLMKGYGEAAVAALGIALKVNMLIVFLQMASASAFSRLSAIPSAQRYEAPEANYEIHYGVHPHSRHHAHNRLLHFHPPRLSIYLTGKMIR
jgi:hypothetical protein